MGNLCFRLPSNTQITSQVAQPIAPTQRDILTEERLNRSENQGNNDDIAKSDIIIGTDIGDAATDCPV